jgi:hypothetical protein
MTPEQEGLYCPVCGKQLVFIWIWQDSASSRIRMFCEDCSHQDEYRPLPKDERTIFSLEGFQRFAARRLLAHVREREIAKQAGGDGGPHTEA